VNILSTSGWGDLGKKAGNGDDDGEGREAWALLTTAMRKRQWLATTGEEWANYLFFERNKQSLECREREK
jgi:hypothetical protein